MKKLNARSPIVMMTAWLIASAVLSAAIVLTGAIPRESSAFAQADASRVAVNADDIGGVVTSAKGPEAGVWVIAETSDLPTKYPQDRRDRRCRPVSVAGTAQSDLQGLGERIRPGGLEGR